MNPMAHFLFGAIFACCLIAFGVELPRRRKGLGKSGMGVQTILLVTVILGSLAVLPQASKFFGDRKLDTGPAFNLFLFHDVLNLAGQKFRLGDGLLDPPVTVFSLCLGVAALCLFYLRSDPSPGWNTLWRDAAYFSVIILCLVAVRSAVSGSGYLFLPKTDVYIDNNQYRVVENTVFSRGGGVVVGSLRDKAITVREAYLAVNKTRFDSSIQEVREAVSRFLYEGQYTHGGRPVYIPPLEYNSLVLMMSMLEQFPASVPEADLSRIISAGSLPRTDFPLPLTIGLPLITFGVCAILIYPAFESDD